MTMLGSPTPLMQRLALLRRRLRIMLVLHGAARCAAALIGAVLGLIFLDYMLHFPGWLRLALSVAVIFSWIVLLIRWVVLPAFLPLSNRFLASKLEDAAGLSHEELLTAVEFLENRTLEKNILAAKTVDQATQVSQTLNPARATTWRSVNHWWFAALLLVIAGAVGALMHSDRAKIAYLRWTDPLGHHEWPLYCQVQLVWNTPTSGPPSLWPRGEPLTLQATVVKGFDPEMQVWLYCRQDGQDIAPVLMTWQGKDHGTLFEKILLPQGDNLDVKVRAGDDNQEPWVEIKIAPRPRFVLLRGQVAAPAYATNVPVYSVDLSQGGLHVIQGSRVTVDFQCDQPVSLSQGAIELAPLDASLAAAFAAPPKVKITGPEEGSASFLARQTFSAALYVRDIQGLQNREGGVFQVDVVPDALPMVQIVDPSHSIDLTPDGHLQVQIQAQDDLGLTTIYLAGHKVDAKPNQPPLFQTSLTWNKLVYDSAMRSFQGQAQTTWSPADSYLGVGDSVILQAVVGDNYRVQTAAGQTLTHPLVWSTGVLVNIRSREEIQQALRSDLEAVRHSIEMLLAAQQQTADATLAIQRSIAETGKATPAQIATLADLAAAQSSEAARADAIRETLGQIGEIAQRNGLEDSPEGKLAAQAGDLMNQASRQNMAPAAVNLNQSSQLAQNPGTVNQAGAALSQAHPQQQTAIQILQQILDELGQQGQFATLKARLVQLIEQQALLQAQLKALAGQTVGQNINDLPPDVVAKLHDLAQRQQALSQSTEQLVNDLHTTAQQVQDTNPAMAQTLNNTATIAQTMMVSQNMTLAGQSINANQVESASDQQGQAAKGLQAMLDEMNKYDQRSLDERQQQLENLIQLVKKLIARQTSLMHTTQALPANAPTAALSPLADQQSHLQLDTVTAANQARQADPAGPSSGDLHDASDAMGSATGDLLRGQKPQATPDQKAALDNLNKALADLQKALNAVLQQQRLQTLQGIEAMYRAIEEQQKNLLDQSQDIVTQVQANGELSRRQLLQLQTMSATEAQLIDSLNAISQRLTTAAPLLVWMNQGIIQAITGAKGQMDQTAADQLMIGDEQYAIQMIQAIIDALDEQIDAAKHGGSGGGGGGGGPLVPPTAQLVLLRTLQMQINAKTELLNTMYKQTTDPDQRLQIQQNIHDLGVIQGQLRQEAIKVIQSMSGGS